MTNFQKIKQLLHGSLDIYENFDYTKYQNTLSPGSMPANPILQHTVTQTSASIIIEVGSFLGWSAYGMATQLKENGVDGVVICVDTWMGGSDHWNETINNPETSRIKRVNGYPTFYYNFLANMCYANLQNIVLPFAYPSITAAAIINNVFSGNNLKADLIYIDGSHLAQDVFNDCLSYFPLLSPKGMLFGDDWQCEDVKYGVNEFCKTENRNEPVIHPNGVHWFLSKI